MNRIALTVAACVLATPALAVDFSQPILGADNKPAEQCADAVKRTGCEPLTLGLVSSAALFADLPTDHETARPGVAQSLPPEQKAKNAALGLRILAAKKDEDVKLTSEDISTLKARIGAAFPPLTILRAWMLLDPNTKL